MKFGVLSCLTVVAVSLTACGTSSSYDANKGYLKHRTPYYNRIPGHKAMYAGAFIKYVDGQYNSGEIDYYMVGRRRDAQFADQAAYNWCVTVIREKARRAGAEGLQRGQKVELGDQACIRVGLDDQVDFSPLDPYFEVMKASQKPVKSPAELSKMVQSKITASFAPIDPPAGLPIPAYANLYDSGSEDDYQSDLQQKQQAQIAQQNKQNPKDPKAGANSTGSSACASLTNEFERFVTNRSNEAERAGSMCENYKMTRDVSYRAIKLFEQCPQYDPRGEQLQYYRKTARDSENGAREVCPR